MSDKKEIFTIKIFNTFSNKHEFLQVTEEIYRTFARTAWNIKDNNKSFFDHEIQWTGLIGGDDNAFENFHEFIVEDDILDQITHESEKKKKLGYEVLEKLPSAMKRRFIKFYYNGLTAKEIAIEEGVSVNTVQDSLRVARKKLKKFLKNHPSKMHLSSPIHMRG